MSTTELCPVMDGSAPVQADAMRQPGSLTLYALTDDLAQLLAVRAEMAEASEDTAAVDAEIAAYMEQLPAKVDAVAHIIRTLESQEELATGEIARLIARRRKIASALERLKQYCCAVLEQQPKPKRGSRKLEGTTATLALVGNGGVEPLDITDESLIPDEMCEAETVMPWTAWMEILAERDASWGANLKARRVVSNGAVRKALAEPCWACEGKGIIPTDTAGESTPCNSCMGDGKSGVPGARLLQRGSHLKIS